MQFRNRSMHEAMARTNRITAVTITLGRSWLYWLLPWNLVVYCYLREVIRTGTGLLRVAEADWEGAWESKTCGMTVRFDAKGRLTQPRVKFWWPAKEVPNDVPAWTAKRETAPWRS